MASVEIIIPARVGEIDRPFRTLIGNRIDGLDPRQQAVFDEGCNFGELYFGEYDQDACTVTTEVMGETVSVTCPGASRATLCAMLPIAAAERM